MADPISPSGSLGQTPVAATAPSPSTAFSAQDLGRKVGRTEANNASPAASGAEPVIVDPSVLVARESSSRPSAKEGMASLEDSVKAFREFLKNLPSDLQLEPDKDSDIVVFKLVNPVTKEVIRQFPSEEIVAMARKLKAMESQSQSKSGIFLDEKT
jgi:flagellar protein FlaG